MANKKTLTIGDTPDHTAEPVNVQTTEQWLQNEENFQKLTEQVKRAENAAMKLTVRFKVEVGEPPRSIFGR